MNDNASINISTFCIFLYGVNSKAVRWAVTYTVQVFVANRSRRVQVLRIRIAELIVDIRKRKAPQGGVQQAHAAELGLQIELNELSHRVVRPSQRHGVRKCKQIPHVIREGISGHRSQRLVQFILTVDVVVATADIDPMLPKVFA